MIKFIKNHLKIIMIVLFAYVYALMVLVVPTGYSVIAPGGLTPMNETFIIDEHPASDHFYTVYVYSYHPITAFQYFMLHGDERMNVYKTTVRQSETSPAESVTQGKLQKTSSYELALINAYEQASLVDASISIDYTFDGLYINDFPRRIDELEIGDIIIAIDGVQASTTNDQSFRVLAYQDDVVFTINRDGDIFTYHYVKQAADLSFWYYPSYTINDANPSYEIPGLNNNIGGPSGGLLQTLSIYVSLLNINLYDSKIAGTGTMNSDGTIGRIGGIRQKILTANYLGVDVFFIPESHVKDIEDLSYDFDIIAVTTIEDALVKLLEYANELD